MHCWQSSGVTAEFCNKPKGQHVKRALKMWRNLPHMREIQCIFEVYFERLECLCQRQCKAKAILRREVRNFSLCYVGFCRCAQLASVSIRILNV